MFGNRSLQRRGASPFTMFALAPLDHDAVDIPVWKIPNQSDASA